MAPVKIKWMKMPQVAVSIARQRQSVVRSLGSAFAVCEPATRAYEGSSPPAKSTHLRECTSHEPMLCKRIIADIVACRRSSDEPNAAHRCVARPRRSARRSTTRLRTRRPRAATAIPRSRRARGAIGRGGRGRGGALVVRLVRQRRRVVSESGVSRPSLARPVRAASPRPADLTHRAPPRSAAGALPVLVFRPFSDAALPPPLFFVSDFVGHGFTFETGTSLIGTCPRFQSPNPRTPRTASPRTEQRARLAHSHTRTRSTSLPRAISLRRDLNPHICAHLSPPPPPSPRALGARSRHDTTYPTIRGRGGDGGGCGGGGGGGGGPTQPREQRHGPAQLDGRAE